MLRLYYSVLNLSASSNISVTLLWPAGNAETCTPFNVHTVILLCLWWLMVILYNYSGLN